MGTAVSQFQEDPRILAQEVNFGQLPGILKNDITNVVSIMSFNIPTKGSMFFDGWNYRKAMIARLVQHYNVDIVAFQEPHKQETLSLYEILKDQYNYFGRGRTANDGSEYQPIFFKKEVFVPLNQGYFWLSDTPDVPGSIGWDAACKRHCVWMQFGDKRNNTNFFVFNTHWDHRGNEARRQSGILMKKKIEEITNGAKVPVFVVGDFNCTLSHPGIISLGLKSMESDPSTTIVGEPYTFVGWQKQYKSSIDFILYRNAKCLQYATLQDEYTSGRLMSDHRPILATFDIQQTQINCTTNQDEDEDALLAAAIQLSLQNK